MMDFVYFLLLQSISHESMFSIIFLIYSRTVHYIYIYIKIHSHVSTYLSVYSSIHVSIYLSLYIYIYIYLYLQSIIFIYIHYFPMYVSLSTARHPPIFCSPVAALSARPTTRWRRWATARRRPGRPMERNLNVAQPVLFETGVMF